MFVSHTILCLAHSSQFFATYLSFLHEFLISPTVLCCSHNSLGLPTFFVSPTIPYSLSDNSLFLPHSSVFSNESLVFPTILCPSHNSMWPTIILLSTVSHNSLFLPQFSILSQNSPFSHTVPCSSHISLFSPTILSLPQFFHSSRFIPTIPHSLLQFSIHFPKSLSLPHFSVCAHEFLVFPQFFVSSQIPSISQFFVAFRILPQFLLSPTILCPLPQISVSCIILCPQNSFSYSFCFSCISQFSHTILHSPPQVFVITKFLYMLESFYGLHVFPLNCLFVLIRPYNMSSLLENIAPAILIFHVYLF